MNYDKIIEEIKKIDDETLNNMVDVDEYYYDIKVDVVERQRLYIWVRLFLKKDDIDIIEGDTIELTYLPNQESITVTFSTWERMGYTKDMGYYVTNVQDIDKSILILMVDVDLFNDDSIPFIRSLFRESRYFDYVMVKRDELIFKNIRTNEVLDYIDCSF
jgi:hypothetical protein